MCGILAWAGPGAQPFTGEEFGRALKLLSHRGPDDHGIWCGHDVVLGHRRLSIIDLTAAGHQPMRSTSGQVHIVFNGEIYNYIELKDELRRVSLNPTGGSDTAVLLEAIEAWGPAALSRLNGMWAFASWNEQRRQLLLSRDRFGVKPLYYRLGADGISFASEPKALLSLFPDNRRMCRETMLDFLAYNQMFAGNKSFYHGIHLLPPAHYAFYDAATNRLTIHRYWNYPTDEDSGVTADQAVEEFRVLFDESVRLRLRSDVPVGIALSGGLDSSSILASGAKVSHRPPICFTSTFAASGDGELSWAKMASRTANADLIEVPAAQEDWLTVLRSVVWHMDAPGYSPAVYPLWCLMGAARSAGVPVLLDGQGADEALGGYPQYSILELLDYMRGRGDPRRISGLYARLNGVRDTYSSLWGVAWLTREMFPAVLRWHRERVGFQSLLRHGTEVRE